MDRKKCVTGDNVMKESDRQSAIHTGKRTFNQLCLAYVTSARAVLYAHVVGRATLHCSGLITPTSHAAINH